MGFELVGQSWTDDFPEYLDGLNLSWAKGVTMHMTASPSLAQRPDGLTDQHIRNIQNYYENQLGWSSGPHLFVDDHRIMGMSSLERRGVHAVSFNASHIGIEVLGNYDMEDPYSGRGADCWENAAYAARCLLEAMDKSVSVINGHRDDPKTSKTCPGRLVSLDSFRNQVAGVAPPNETRLPSDDDGISEEDLRDTSDAIVWQALKLKEPDPDIDQIVEAIEWKLAKLK